ncbi:hypothetical protein Tco_1506970 [Tanacetum coccineum]
MSNMSEDIQYAGSDTRPPMLDKTDFESWQQRIRLYCLGKDNGENIMKSITEGPFQMGTMRDTLAAGTEGAFQQGPVRARVFIDLFAEEKERLKADIRTTNILLQGSSSTDNLIESLTNTLSLLTQSYKSHLPQMNNQLRNSSNARNKATVQDGRVVVQDVQGIGYIARECPQPKRPQNSKYYKDKMLLMNAHNNGVVLNEEQLLFFAGEQATNFDDDNHVHANLTSEDVGPSYDSNISSEVQDREYYSDCEDEYHEVHEMQSEVQHKYVVDSDADYTSDSNIIPYDQYVEDNEENVIQCNVSSVQSDALMSILDEMHEDSVQQGVQSRLANKPNTVINDSLTSELVRKKELEVSDFNSFFKIKNLEHQIQEKDNVIRDLKVLVSNVNARNCEPYNVKDVTDLLEQNERLRAENNKIEDLKAQLEGNLKNATRNFVKTKVLAPGMYAIDVEPIPPRLNNNRSAHLDYINHLKESVETVREIVEEARVVKPLDTAFNSACKYTKLSQELVEYVIGTCPKEFKERDNKAAAFIPLIRQKQVTFNDTCIMSINDT